MKRNIIPALKTLGMSAFAVFISFFVYFSLHLIVMQFSTEVVGYTVYGKNGEEIGVFEEPPAELSEEITGYAEKRSDMTVGATALLGILQVFCGVGIVFCTVGSVIAKEAARDRNDADFNNAAQDKMRGFKIGGLAVMPMLAAGVAAVVLKILGGASAGFYWFYRWVILCPVKPIFDLLTGNATDFSGAPLWSVIVSVGFTALFLAFCGVMYIICYNEDSVIAKLLYKSAKRKKENVRKMGR